MTKRNRKNKIEGRQEEGTGTEKRDTVAQRARETEKMKTSER